MTNPYSAPSAESLSDGTDATTSVSLSLGALARQVFLAWEKLRVGYVVVVGLFTLLLTGSEMLKAPLFLKVAEGAIFANVCFFAGPLAETFVRLLGYRGRALRWVLFTAGTLFTLGLALMTLAGELLPDQN